MRTTPNADTSTRPHADTSPHRARQGKLARLPYELREQLCRRMRDGWSGPRLIAWLASAAPDVGPLNAQNLTNWRQGGYQDWLRDQARLDAIRASAETTRRELEAGGFSVLDKAIYDLAEKLTDAAETDPAKAALAIAAMKTAVTGAGRLQVAERRAQLAEDALSIERQKFQRQTCELFLKWAADKRAQEIAAGAASTDVKMDELIKLMFGQAHASGAT